MVIEVSTCDSYVYLWKYDGVITFLGSQVLMGAFPAKSASYCHAYMWVGLK